MKSYKTELDLTDKQRTACLQHAGAARWAYNYGLERKKEAYEKGEKVPTAVDMHRELVVLKHTTAPWLADVSKYAPQTALRNLDRAFDGFFRRCKAGAAKKGYPQFKSRKRGIGSFTLTGDTRKTGSIHATETAIKLPRLGVLRLHEHGYFPTDVRIKSATVSERAGRWFVAIRTDETPVRPLGVETLGVDVGIKSLAVLSDGTTFKNPHTLAKAQAKLARLQRQVARKVKGSANRKKAVAKVARAHYRVACVRRDSLNKISDSIAKRSAVVVLETLHVAGMVKNHSLARAVSDAGMAELHRQVEYKMAWAGGVVIRADRFYPSSKTCSACGRVRETLKLSERVFCCDCGFECDRDHNAAINLRNLAVGSTVAACGPEMPRSAGSKQEPGTGVASDGGRVGLGEQLEFVVTGVAGEPRHEHAREAMLRGAFTVDAVMGAMARGLRGDLAWLAGSVEPAEAGGAA